MMEAGLRFPDKQLSKTGSDVESLTAADDHLDSELKPDVIRYNSPKKEAQSLSRGASSLSENPEECFRQMLKASSSSSSQLARSRSTVVATNEDCEAGLLDEVYHEEDLWDELMKLESTDSDSKTKTNHCLAFLYSFFTTARLLFFIIAATNISIWLVLSIKKVLMPLAIVPPLLPCAYGMFYLRSLFAMKLCTIICMNSLYLWVNQHLLRSR